MKPYLASTDLEETAPATLRSPPSSLRVRDFAVQVEVQSGEYSVPPQSLLGALLDSYDDYEDTENQLPTCRYARVA